MWETDREQRRRKNPGNCPVGGDAHSGGKVVGGEGGEVEPFV